MLDHFLIFINFKQFGGGEVKGKINAIHPSLSL